MDNDKPVNASSFSVVGEGGREGVRRRTRRRREGREDGREADKEGTCRLSCSVVSVCNPLGCSSPGSSVHGIFQTRILEWV